MIRSIYCAADGSVALDLDLDGYRAALNDQGGLLWVDLAGELPASCRPLLLDTFGFHPLAVDDALVEVHVPKVDDWSRYLYVVLHGVVLSGSHLETLELDVFLGPNFLVTYQARPIPAVERVLATCRRDERHLQRSAPHLLYLLADELVNDAMPAVDEIDAALDRIEDRIFDSARAAVLEDLFPLKRALLNLRRILAPQREVLNRLARGGYPVLSPDHAMFFRDVYDHLVRLYDITESLRDLASGALDTYLSVVNNRMNDVMKVLTIFTALFMPISFLSGFFGMNFFQPTLQLDRWTGAASFGLTLAAVVLVPLIMLWWVKRRGWL